jgi:hypothetical protein
MHVLSSEIKVSMLAHRLAFLAQIKMSPAHRGRYGAQMMVLIAQ